MQIVERIEIDRSPADVWAVIADPTTHTTWRPALVEFHQLSDAPLGVGSRIREVLRFRGREIELEDVVTAFEPAHRLGLRGGWKAADFESELVLDAVGDGTVVSFDWTFHPKSLLVRVASPFLKRTMQHATREELENLKSYVEKVS